MARKTLPIDTIRLEAAGTLSMARKTLPIDTIRLEVESRLEKARIVISAPTGSGKSTQVPRWCASHGSVLVVEPRRVACRSLASRVAELEGTSLGARVGYSVRDEQRLSAQTRILFATPGIVLRMMASDEPDRFHTIILDEFHERRLDVDLIFALLLERFPAGNLLVMSATLDGEGVARHMGGVHVRGEGRLYPVEHRYVPTERSLPDDRKLEHRIATTVEAARALPGDILVFLPGKAEIARARDALLEHHDLEIRMLHGGLSLQEQSRVFMSGGRRRVILSTNVAETSLTIPGVGVVIDSGLVRRTAYHNGRGFLSLVSIAADSADQRAGRAGRLRPGTCFRLWSREARLDSRTPPEIHRESLVPLVLAAAACGADAARSLPFLDQPKPHALEAARDELQEIGALDSDGRITARGRALFGLPLDASLGNLLIAAEAAGCLEDAIDLAGLLAVGRPLYRRGPPDPRDEWDIRQGGCDAVAYIRAARGWRPGREDAGGGRNGRDKLDPFTLEEGRAISARLRRAFGLPKRTETGAGVDRRRLALTILEADARCAHVARRRKKRVAWSNGGTELELSQDSAATLVRPEAIAVLGTQAVGFGYRDRRIFATCAMPISLDWMVEAGLGRERLGNLRADGGRVVASIERVYARRVLATREEVPAGDMAREAIVKLFLKGEIFPEARRESESRLEAWALHAKLAARGALELPPSSPGREPEEASPWDGPIPSLEAWTMSRLTEMGVESGEDLALLSARDLLAPDLPAPVRRFLDREFPRTLSVGDAFYRVHYDLSRREVTLEKVRGTRREPPSPAFLPAFRGMRVQVEDRGRIVVLEKYHEQ